MTEEQGQIENTENTLVEELLGVDIEPDPIEQDEIIVEDVKKPAEEKPDVKKELTPEEDQLKKDGVIDKKINRRVDARIERLEKKIEKRLTAEMDAYVGAIATVRERLEDALENNNIKEYKQAEDALNRLNIKKEEIAGELEDIKSGDKDIKEEESIEKKEAPKKNIPIDDAAGRWLQTNKKFADRVDNDAELSAVARAVAQKLLKNGYEGKPQIELLTEVKRQMLLKMPEDFEDLISAKDELPNVSGGKMDISSTNNGGGKKIYTMNDVPAIDRQILKNYVTAKVYKDEKEAVTKYFQRKQQENR